MAKLNAEILVIGIGSTLRSDDAAGRRAALVVESWNLPHVTVLALVQLTPELAAPVSSSKCVIFIDACPSQMAKSVEVALLEPYDERTAASVGHSADPRSLLALAREAFGTCPPAWLVSIPAVDFSIGETLSEMAEHGLAQALIRIGALLAK